MSERDWGVPARLPHQGLTSFADSGGDTTTSTTFVNMAGSAQGTSILDFPKGKATTGIEVSFHTTFYVSGAGAAGVEFAVLFDGTDWEVALLNEANGALFNHVQVSGIRIIGSGVAAGFYTIQQRWRVTSGAGTATRDLRDMTTMVVSEVELTF